MNASPLFRPRAGVAVRSCLCPFSADVLLFAGGDGTIWLQLRKSDHKRAKLTSVGTATTGSPLWLRLVRVGREVLPATSGNGMTWTELTPQRFKLKPDEGPFAGLIASSGDPSRLADATFARAAVASLPNAPRNLAATASSTGQVTLAWVRDPDDASGVIVERSIKRKKGFDEIQSLTPDATGYVDPVDVRQSRQYFYRVLSVSMIGSSSSPISLANRSK